MIGSVHLKIPADEDSEAALDWSFLDIVGQIGEFDSLEAEGFYLFLYLFEAFVVAAGVGHLAVVVVEVDESSSVALKCAVVLVEEGL